MKNELLPDLSSFIERETRWLEDYTKRNKIIKLESEIASFKLSQALKVYQDEDEQKEQRRRIWKLNIIKHKEDTEFLKKMGLKKI